MQFTRSGHTQLRANAIMITSTITVVLFSTVVRHLPLFLYRRISWSGFSTLDFHEYCSAITLLLILTFCMIGSSFYMLKSAIYEELLLPTLHLNEMNKRIHRLVVTASKAVENCRLQLYYHIWKFC